MDWKKTYIPLKTAIQRMKAYAMTNMKAFASFYTDYQTLIEAVKSYKEVFNLHPPLGEDRPRAPQEIREWNEIERIITAELTYRQAKRARKALSRLRRMLSYLDGVDGRFPTVMWDFYQTHKDGYATASQFYYNILVKQVGKTNLQHLMEALTQVITESDILAPIGSNLIARISRERSDALTALDSIDALIDPYSLISDDEQLIHISGAKKLLIVLNRMMHLVEGDPRHDDIMPFLFQDTLLKKFLLANEMSLWFKNEKTQKLITGHLDNLLLIDGALYVMDYKPGDENYPHSTKLTDHLFQSIPQVASYALMLERMLGLKSSTIPVYCVSYNSKGAYIYKPTILSTISTLFQETHLKPQATWPLHFSTYDRDYARYISVPELSDQYPFWN